MNYLFSITSGILLGLIFPKFNLFHLAWIALVPLLIAIYRTDSLKSAFVYGLMAGLFFFGINTSWVTVLSDWVGPLSFLAWILLTIYQALYLGAFAFLLNLQLTTYNLQLFAVPALFVVLEWLRSLGLFGVTGGGLGYSQWTNLPLIQIASLTGVYGITFLIVLVNVSITEFFLRRKRGQLFLVLALLLMVYLYGFNQLTTYNLRLTAYNLKVATIQGNIPQKMKMDYRFNDYVTQVHEDLTRQATLEKPNLIIWPETTVLIYPTLNSVYFSKIKNLAVESRSDLIFGTPYFEQGKIYNSALAISSSGETLNRYDKYQLVPFGEYLPFRPIVYPFLKSYPLFAVDYNTNPKQEVLKITKAKIGTVICFESTFPYLVRDKIKKGADFILVITNDAWFKDSDAAYQHLSFASLRAVENRTYVVQVANTGLSAIIDPCGRILAKTNLNERVILLGKIYFRKPETFYSKYGEVAVYFSLIILTGVILIRLFPLGTFHLR